MTSLGRLSLAPAKSDARTWRGRAFGLELTGDAPLPGVPEAQGPGVPRQAAIALVSPHGVQERWPSAGTEVIIDRRFEDGRPMMRVEHHADVGYRIWAPRHGRHLVSSDGSHILSALPDVPAWCWQRLLFAQVLPLAASLQGIELLHASAVELGGRALAFLAPSGTGKTSIVAHLVARGATLITDDALALEPDDARLIAHPGAGMVSVHATEVAAMRPLGRARLGRVLGESDKVHLAIDTADRPLPLGGVYLVSRRRRFQNLEINELPQPDPASLLAGTFVPYLDAAEHLERHLDVCARIASSVPMFELLVPPFASAIEVAAAVETHASESSGGPQR